MFINSNILSESQYALKNVAKFIFDLGIFNINEPVLFGYPPFMQYFNSYSIYHSSKVRYFNPPLSNKVTGSGESCIYTSSLTTPVFLNAWLATAGDVRAVLVQFIILYTWSSSIHSIYQS